MSTATTPEEEVRPRAIEDDRIAETKEVTELSSTMHGGPCEACDDCHQLR